MSYLAMLRLRWYSMSAGHQMLEEPAERALGRYLDAEATEPFQSWGSVQSLDKTDIETLVEEVLQAERSEHSAGRIARSGVTTKCQYLVEELLGCRRVLDVVESGTNEPDTALRVLLFGGLSSTMRTQPTRGDSVHRLPLGLLVPSVYQHRWDYYFYLTIVSCLER